MNINYDDPRAVVDYYKYWNDEAIKAHLDTKRHNFTLVLENDLKDLNLGCNIRNANAFMAHQIILFGRKHYDRRAAVGTYKYQHIRHAPDINVLNDMLAELNQPLDILAVDIDDNAIPVRNYKWNFGAHTVLCLGHEGRGLDPELVELSNNKIYIRQYGSARSLNVSVAGGIIMNEYCEALQNAQSER